MTTYKISTGRSRKEVRWHNEEWQWGDLVSKLSATHHTHETVKEYAAASRDRRSEIKDCGGFVGGHVNGGRRVKGAVTSRSLLTLDIDSGDQNTFALLKGMLLNYDTAGVIYSTHSHTAKNPRFRLVCPLSREADADEYEAIGRKFAERTGIDAFDDTTYQSERLMYWPSTSSDGEYIFEEMDGAPFDVDRWLSFYEDWRDVSQWPTSSRQLDIVRKAMTKQGEPTEKPGIVGEFCRVYTISAVIEEHLQDVYATTEDPNRYTYINGSSSCGLVVYDDKFAYSHHGTDPCGGRLCNAFDLVRIHKFGEQDSDVKPDTPINRLPSYLAMEKFARNDGKVKKAEAEETIGKMKSDFANVKIEDAEKEQDWVEQLSKTKGQYDSSSKNILMILENAPGLKNNLRRDEMAKGDIILHDLPWRTYDKGKWWTDEDDANLLVYLENLFNITGRDKILNARVVTACAHGFHPIKEYLNGLPKWDGVERLDHLFIKYLGAKDDELTHSMTRKAFTAAVARIFQPGCKFDHITVLQGSEGIGKSTILRKMFSPWFSDSQTDMSGKEGMEQIQGFWGIEIGELTAIKNSEVEAVKNFISKQVDDYRPAYHRNRVKSPRQCVFFATTNEETFLKGENGNRRFWVIPCGGALLSAANISDAEKAQIWAEAKACYDEGEDLYLNARLEAASRERQKEVNDRVNDVRIGMVEEFLRVKLPADWAARSIDERQVYLADEKEQEENGINERDKVCVAEVLCECLKMKIDDKNRYISRDIGKMIEAAGWTRDGNSRFPIYGVQKGYIRPQEETQNWL